MVILPWEGDVKTYAPIEIHSISLDQLNSGDCLVQTAFWGRFKESQGWQPLAFSYNWRGQSGQLLVLVRKLFRFLPLAYVPFGPLLPDEDQEAFLASLSWGLVSELPLGTLYIRYDLTGGITEDALEARKSEEALDRSVLKLGEPLLKAFQDIQPPDTVILPLHSSKETLMGQMHKKWRYNIRLAAKKGVQLESSSHPDLKEWYEMYRTTSERDKIAIHPQSYYQRLFDMAASDESLGPRLRLITARHEGDLLAGIIVAFQGQRATYLYGASSNHKRNLMPSYALQWEAIQQALDAGCTEYDFFGIPPSNDSRHPMHGLFLFKTGFGGQIHHYLGAWDFPYGRVFYHLYRLAERVRLWYFKRFRKR